MTLWDHKIRKSGFNSELQPPRRAREFSERRAEFETSMIKRNSENTIAKTSVLLYFLRKYSQTQTYQMWLYQKPPITYFFPVFSGACSATNTENREENEVGHVTNGQ